MTLSMSILLLFIISFINPTAKERVIDHTLNQLNLTNKVNNESIHIFTKVHTHLYMTAYKIFLENKILGVGVKNFRNFCVDEKYIYNNDKRLSCSSHPHNTYLQILTETGIIGFLFLIIIVFYFCKLTFKHLFSKFKGKYYFSDFEICILSGILIYLWPIVPTGSVFNNWLNIIMILNLPFIILSRKLIKIEKF